MPGCGGLDGLARAVVLFDEGAGPSFTRAAGRKLAAVVACDDACRGEHAIELGGFHVPAASDAVNVALVVVLPATAAGSRPLRFSFSFRESFCLLCHGSQDDRFWAAKPAPAARRGATMSPMGDLRGLLGGLVLAAVGCGAASAGSGCDGAHSQGGTLEATGAPESTPESSVVAQGFPRLAVRRLVARQISPGRAPARVQLATRGTEGLRVEDARTGRGIEVMPSQQDLGVAEAVSGGVVYRSARGQHHLTLTWEGGVETFVRVEDPATETLSWAFTVDEMSGLRLVHDTLELLASDGSPLLRVPPPMLIDSGGSRHRAALQVEGCAVDRAATSPVGRQPLAPGSPSCTLRVSWDGAQLSYPLLVDPAWTTTGDLIIARHSHAQVTLQSGRVLIAGGKDDNKDILASAEIFDPAANGGLGAFVSTNPLPQATQLSEATLLADGRVLVTGGLSDDTTVIDAASVYDAAAGNWTATAGMFTPRTSHAVAVTSTGRALVVGGYSSAAPIAATATAELFDPTSNTFASAAPLGDARGGLWAVALTTGEVLIGGGVTATNTAVLKTELYDVGTNTYSPGSSAALVSDQAVLLDGDEVLVTKQLRSTMQIYDRGASALGSWRLLADYPGPDNLGRATRLGSGNVLFAGIPPSTLPQTTTARFDPSQEIWLPAAPLVVSRTNPGLSTLLDGRALITGGVDDTLHPTASAAIYEEVETGGACTSNEQCVTGFCVDGVCCNTACTGTCSACIAAGTGQPDGACAPVLDGADPRNDCVDSAPASCALDGRCDGSGSCRRYPDTSSCTPGPCTSDAECSTGFCTDGVCCDSRCNGECVACSMAARAGGGVDGQCAPVSAGQDPAGECDADAQYPESCLGDGQCDGQGACRSFAVPGTVCGDSTCSNGQLQGELCDGSGNCTVDQGASCGAYACDGDACGSSCVMATECASDAYCDAGSCVFQAENGAGCSADRECRSGSCVDGVCCNSACAGQCEACDVAGTVGTCTPVTGAPHGSRPACPAGTPSAPCTAAECDGSERTACLRFVSAVECQAPSCDNGVEVPAAFCDGQGACVAGSEPRACAPYLCGATSCADSCSSDDDCTAGTRCDVNNLCVASATCIDEVTRQDVDGDLSDCTPARCRDGVCLDSCTSTADCASGFSCDPDGDCVPVPSAAASGDGGGCGCRFGSRPASTAPLALLLLPLVLRRRRRARKR